MWTRPARPRFAPAARSGSGGRQGDRRGPRSLWRWCSSWMPTAPSWWPRMPMQPFVPASVTKIVTAWLAMEVLGEQLPLRDPLLPRRQAGALRARRRRSFPDLGGAGAARGRGGRRGRQEADHRHRARRELLSLRTSASRASRTTARPTMR